MSASTALATALLIVRLPPVLRDPLVELVGALIAADAERERRALDAFHEARRVNAPLLKAR